MSGHEEEANITQRKLGYLQAQERLLKKTEMPEETGGVEDHSSSRAPTGEDIHEDTPGASPGGSLPTAVGRALAGSVARVPRQTLGRCSRPVVLNLPNAVTL